MSNSTDKQTSLPSVDFSFHIPTPPAPQQPLSNPGQSEPPFRFSFQIPEPRESESTAPPPHDKGQGDEALFEVPTHERPLTAEDAEGVDKLNLAQIRHLVEKFRAEITMESRPGHRAEFEREMEQKKQTSLDEKLAAEKGRWEEEEKGEVVASADSVIAMIESMKEKLGTMDEDLHASFLAGEEKGYEDAMGEHTFEWGNMDDQLADKEEQLQRALGEKKILAARVAEQAKKIAKQEQEADKMTWKLGIQSAALEESLKLNWKFQKSLFHRAKMSLYQFDISSLGVPVFGLLVGLLLGLLVGKLFMALSTTSTTYPGAEMWPGRDEMSPLRAGGGYVFGDDPMLDLSRGMYGV